MRKCQLLILLFIWLSLQACSSLQPVKQSCTPFERNQRELILAGESDQPMRVYQITNRQDSILLRSRSEDVRVDPKDPVLHRLVERMQRTVTDSMSLGVGIAAPQVGILRNVILVQRLDKEGLPWESFLNPRILQYSKKKQVCREGCLSIPDRRDTTRTRAYAILLEYDRLDGSREIEMVEDFTAVIFQHEIDHLNGILYIDHLQEEISESKRRSLRLGERKQGNKNRESP